MKILLVSDYMFESGGIFSHLMDLKAGLEEAGHEVRMLFSRQGGENDADQDVNTFRALKERGLIFRMLQFYNPIASRAIRSTIRDFNPDVIHFHYIFNQASPSVIYASHKKAIPTVLTVHGFEMVHFNRRVGRFGLSRVVTNNIETSTTETLILPTYAYKYIKFLAYKKAFQRLDAFIAPSRYAKGLLSPREQEKTFVVPHGIKLFDATPVTSHNKIVFVGRIIRGKGVHVLLKAMVDVVASIPDAQLTICGDGPALEDSRKLAYQLGINKNVSFVGRVKHSEVEGHIKNNNALVMPSVRPETFSVTGMEALSAGRAVISTNLGAVPEWLDAPACGTLVEAGDHGQLANAIIELLQDSKRQQAIEIDAPLRASRYDRKTMVVRTIGAYKTLIKKAVS